MLINFVNKILSLGTIVSQIFIIWVILHLIFFRKSKNPLSEFVTKHWMALSFTVALASVAASLFYSEIAGFEPCFLCWYQRIFMYPLVILLFIALLKKYAGIVDYVLPLAVIGGAISLYHNIIYYYQGGLPTPCQALGQVSCVKLYVFEFGYITIPVMALTGFALIIIFTVFAKTKKYN